MYLVQKLETENKPQIPVAGCLSVLLPLEPLAAKDVGTRLPIVGTFGLAAEKP